MITSVMVDQREPMHIQKANYGCDAIVTLLDAGDVWAACDDDRLLVVERKTGLDLLASIADGRLFDQCARMRDVSPWSYVIITGQITANGTGYAWVDGRATDTHWRYDAVQGALLTCQEIGVGIIMTYHDGDFPAAIQRLGNRNRETLKIMKRRDTQFWGAGESALLALPGIGEKHVTEILKHAGTPALALSWLTVLGEGGVPGVGDGTKKAVRQALKLKQNEELHIYATIEGA